MGLAVVVPAAKIFAFDTDFISRAQVRRLAALNDVTDRLHVHAFCRHADLDRLSTDRTLVVCDIEGFEAQLLDPATAPALWRGDILAEVHEASDASFEVEHLLQARFAASHHVERITAGDRDTWIEQNTPRLPTTVPRDALRAATEEHRAAGRVWLWMQSVRV